VTELVITGAVEGYCDVETGVCVPAADEAADEAVDGAVDGAAAERPEPVEPDRAAG
jgi:hypothetical protein